VVPAGELAQETLLLARKVLLGAPLAIAHTKKVLNELCPVSFNQELDQALLHHLSGRASSEAGEGIAAFLEKRAPNWQPKKSTCQ